MIDQSSKFRTNYDYTDYAPLSVFNALVWCSENPDYEKICLDCGYVDRYSTPDINTLDKVLRSKFHIINYLENPTLDIICKYLQEEAICIVITHSAFKTGYHAEFWYYKESKFFTPEMHVKLFTNKDFSKKERELNLSGILNLHSCWIFKETTHD
jgi:hypothetical protein